MKDKGLKSKIPIYKTAEYRLLCFIDDIGVHWVSKYCNEKMAKKLRNPIIEMKEVIKEFLREQCQ